MILPTEGGLHLELWGPFRGCVSTRALKEETPSASPAAGSVAALCQGVVLKAMGGRNRVSGW